MGYRVAVRYGALKSAADFETTLSDLRVREEVVVRSDRGTETGQVIRPPAPVDETTGPALGAVLRRMTEQDREQVSRIDHEQMEKERRFCREKIREHRLSMKLVDVEHLLGGEKIIFYFLAEGRVDFRELVKDLAREYRTRIEMKQIGVRDEARLLADLDHCGREICCRTFIKSLEPVTMKMAKAQKATLDPAKISGRCGRLMCCLRYEDKVYDELKKNLPRKGQRVVTEAGTAEVITYDIMSQTLTVEYQDGRRMKVPLSRVQKVLPREEKRGGDQRGPGNRSDAENRRSRSQQPVSPTKEPEASGEVSEPPVTPEAEGERQEPPDEAGGVNESQ